jgi:hypothetical protein
MNVVMAQDDGKNVGKTPETVVFKAKEPGDDQFHLYFYDVNFHQIILATNGMVGYPNFDITCSSGSFLLTAYTTPDANGLFDATIFTINSAEIGKSKGTAAISVSPDGKYAVVVKNNAARMVNLKTKTTLYIAPFRVGSQFHWSQSSMYVTLTDNEKTYIVSVADNAVIEAPPDKIDWSADDRFLSEQVNETLHVRQYDSPYLTPLSRSSTHSIWSAKTDTIVYLEKNDKGSDIKSMNAISGERQTIYSSTTDITQLYWLEVKLNRFVLVLSDELWLLSTDGSLERIGNYTDVQNVCEA